MTAMGSVLTSVDHLPAFSVEPPGVLVLRHQYRDGEFVSAEVRHADPEVTFSWELLENVYSGFDPNINDGVVYPEMRLSMPEMRYCTCGPASHKYSRCFMDALLHIDADDQHVIYRIGTYDSRNEWWSARWPD